MKSIHPLKLLPVLLISVLAGGCAAVQDSASDTAMPISSATSMAAVPTDSPVPQGDTLSFALTSPAFGAGEEMAARYTYTLRTQCSGENYSPALEWTGTPDGTESFALTMIDPDGSNWIHWVVYNIPGDAAGLPEAIGGPEIGTPGRNNFGQLGYGGPCPFGGTHGYVFTLYALDAPLDLQEGASFWALQGVMEDHILAEATLIGARTR